MMQNGMRNADGDRMAGLREMLQRLRERREELKDSGDLGGVYDEIAKQEAERENDAPADDEGAEPV